MLFSDEKIVQALNNRFEPVWVSLRPVPIVRIDFGNGSVITRTLHGNIASYVLRSDGVVVDVLPGIYEPSAYYDNLDQLWWLARYSTLQKNYSEFLGEYHEKQTIQLAQYHKPGRIAPFADLSKAAIEINVETILETQSNRSEVERVVPGKEFVARPDFSKPEQFKRWSKLAEDTGINELERRLAIHRLLAGAGAVKPEAITRRIYKDILHADLDDPYLGLGRQLFASYPFSEDLVGENPVGDNLAH